MQPVSPLRRFALTMLSVFALTTLAEAQTGPKALVYCPVGLDTSGCDNIVAALGAAGSGFAGGVDRGYDGTSGTVDLATASLSAYAVIVVPSLADDPQAKPYARLRDATVAARLRAAVTGRRAVWSGTPDLGTASPAEKTALLQNLAAWATGGTGTGLVALLDNSDDVTHRYDWLPGVAAIAVTADTSLDSYAAVQTLTAAGAAIATVGGQPLAYVNMAAFGIHAGAGASEDARGVAADGSSGAAVLVTSAGSAPAGTTTTATQPASSGLRALVYCPVSLDSRGCDNVVAALTAGGTPFTGGADRGYDGAGGTVDLRTADLAPYGVFIVPSLADAAQSQPYAMLRDPAVAGRLKPLLQGPVAVWSGTPDLGDSSQTKKNILITNLAKWAAGARLTAGQQGLVAFQDASDAEPTRYAWLSGISRVSVAADTSLDLYSNVQALTPTAVSLLDNGSGLQLGYNNMASFGLLLAANAGLGVDAMGGRTASVVLATSASAGGAGGSIAVVTTDREDYAPGEIVTITGAGWQPSETVNLVLHEDPLVHGDRTLSAVADSTGRIFNQSFSPEPHDVGVRFVLTATGSLSGRVAHTTFTDGNAGNAPVTLKDATCNTNFTGPVPFGGSICASMLLTVQGSGTANFRVEWIAPSGGLSRATDFLNKLDGTFTDVLPSANTGGTWTVRTCKGSGLNACNGGNVLNTTTFTVTQPTTTSVARTAGANPSIYGDALTFTATVSYTATSGSPTGSVTFKDGASVLGTVSLGTCNTTTKTCPAAFSTSALNVAGSPHSITAQYGGDASFTGSTSSALLQTVNAKTLTGTPDSKSRVYGAPNPTFTVAYSGFVNGETSAVVTGSLACSSTAGPSSAAGTYPITCSGQTAPNYSITYVAGTLTVTAASTQTAITSDAPDPSTPGQAFDVKFTVTALSPSIATPDGTVTVTVDDASGATCSASVAVGKCTITLTTTGDKILTVSYAGTSNFLPSSATEAHQVTRIATTTTVATSGSPSDYGQSVTFTATVTPAVPGSPSGTVTFKDGATTLGTGTLSCGSSCTATFAINSLDVAGSPHQITAAYPGDGGFAASASAAVAQTVKAVPLTITANDVSRLYGAATPALGVSYGGFVLGQGPAALGGTLVCSTSAVANSTVAGSPYDITCSGQTSTNYTITYKPGKLTITPAPLAITADDQTRVFGAPDPAFTASYAGFVLGEAAAALTGTLTCTSTAAAASTVPGSPYPITCSGQGSTNYDIAYHPGSLTITRAATATTAGSATGTYGQPNVTLTATVTAQSPSTAAVNEGAVVFTVKHGATTVATATSGTVSSGAASASLALGTAVSAGSYTVEASYSPGPDFQTSTAASPGTLTVNPAATATAAGTATATYGDAHVSLTATVAAQSPSTAPVNEGTVLFTVKRADNSVVGTATSGTVSGGAASASFALGTAVNAGNYIVDATYQPAATPNFLTSAGSGTLTVNKATPTIAWSNPAPIVYGTALSATQLNAAASGVGGAALTGTFLYSPAAGMVLDAGAGQTLSVAFTPTGADAVNYTDQTKSVLITVDRAPLSVAANSANRVFGEPNPTFTGTLAGVVNSDNITDTYAAFLAASGPGASTPVTQATPVGSYPIVPNLVDPAGRLSNYIVTATNGLLTINPASTTMAAANRSATYGDANVLLNAIVSAVSPSLATVAEGTVLFTVKRTDNTVVGTVTSGTVSGGAASATFPLGTAVNAGSYAIEATYQPASPKPNFLASTTTTPATLTIEKAQPTIAWNNPAAIVYGTALSATQLNATASGVGGAALTGTFLYTPASGTVLNAGAGQTLSVAFTPTGADAVNYTDQTKSVLITVDRAPLSVAANSASRVFGAPNPTFTGSLTGVVNGDNITVTYAAFIAAYAAGAGTPVDGSTPVGDYPIVPTLVDPAGRLANYQVTVTNGLLTINPASTTTVAANGTATFGDANVVLNATVAAVSPSLATVGEGTVVFTVKRASDQSSVGLPISSAVSGGTATAPFALGTAVNAGAYLITAEYHPASPKPNFLASATATAASLTIEKATPAVSVIGGVFIYDANPHAASGAVTGVGSPPAALGTPTFSYAGTGSTAYGPIATAPTGAGTYQVTGAFAGNDNYLSAQATAVLTINQAPTALSDLAAPSITRGAVSTVLNGRITSGTLIPTGNVAITLSGLTKTALIGGDGSFTASFTTEALIEGSYPITYAYGEAESTNFGASTDTRTLTVGPNAAPSIVTIAPSLSLAAINTGITVSTTFTDADPAESAPYQATINWGDGSSSTGAQLQVTIPTAGGPGTVTGSHSYAQAGVYTLTVTVNNKPIVGGGDTEQYQYVVIYNPDGGFVTGGGWIMSPTGAYVPNPTLTGKANFGFVSKYQKGATVPTGNTEFQFQTAGLNFKSTSYEWLVISGSYKAQYKGTGTLNGVPGYGFMLTAIDGKETGGGGADKFRIKITGPNGLVYDNQMNSSDTTDPTTTLGGGSIVVHK